MPGVDRMTASLGPLPELGHPGGVGLAVEGQEAEQLMGRCAFRAFQVTNGMCTALAVVLAVGALVFDIGFLPSFVVCLI